MTGEEITNTEDYLALTTYLTQVYDTFRGEIPHIKHPKLVSLGFPGLQFVAVGTVSDVETPHENPQTRIQIPNRSHVRGVSRKSEKP